MKRKFFLGFGLLFLISAGAGLSFAHHSTADNHMDNHDHHEDDFVDRIWDWTHGGNRCDLHNQTDHCNSNQSWFSRPMNFWGGNFRQNNWTRVPRVQTRVIRPTVIQQPVVVEQPQYTYTTQAPVYEQPAPSNFYGHIRSERVGNRTNFYVDQSASTNWEWHYNSHAVNCDLIQGNNLTCWVINPSIPSEVWAEFFVQDGYNRNQTFESNRINI